MWAIDANIFHDWVSPSTGCFFQIRESWEKMEHVTTWSMPRESAYLCVTEH